MHERAVMVGVTRALKIHRGREGHAVTHFGVLYWRRRGEQTLTVRRQEYSGVETINESCGGDLAVIVWVEGGNAEGSKRGPLH